MEHHPKIGVIVPIYNVERYLKNCLISLMNQTYPHLIFVLINDGSTDKSLEIAKSFCALDSRFILISNDFNEGVSRARNKGIKFFQREYFNLFSQAIDYLLFVDGDDSLQLNCIEIFLDYAQKYDLDLVTAGFHRVTLENQILDSNFGVFKEIPKFQVFGGKEIIEMIKVHFFYATTNLLIKFDFFKKINLNFIEGIIYEDHHFGTTLFFKAKRVMVLEYYFYNNILSINSITRPQLITPERKYLNFRSWFLTIKNFENDAKELEWIKPKIKKFYFPMLCESFLQLDAHLQKDNFKKLKEFKKYWNLKSFLILQFPRFFFWLREIKGVKDFQRL